VDSIGIFFIDSAGTAHKVTHRLTQNTPKSVIVRVPAGLISVEYTLRIVTKYSSGATDLNELRKIDYDVLLTVEKQKQV
jgi:hypothetical protein